jgi:hypothetical protein
VAWIKVHIHTSLINTVVLNLSDEITLADTASTHIEPNCSKHHLSLNGTTSTVEYASAKDYPSIEAILKKLFLQAYAPPVVGQANTIPAIIIRSAGDKEKRLLLILVRLSLLCTT